MGLKNKKRQMKNGGTTSTTSTLSTVKPKMLLSSVELEKRPIVNKIETLEEFAAQFEIISQEYELAQEKLAKTKNADGNLYSRCFARLSHCIEYLNKLSNLQYKTYSEQIKNAYFIAGDILIRTVPLNIHNPITQEQLGVLSAGIGHLRKCINIDPYHKGAIGIFKVVMMFLTIHSSNYKENLNLLKQVEAVEPHDYQLQYNLGFTYHRNNQLDESVMHYKLAIGIIDLLLVNNPKDVNLNQFKIKCLNGIGNVYFSVQNRQLALYFFELAEKVDPNDPDVLNQIGVIYTELRIPDKATSYYERGIKNYEKAHISMDKTLLIASMYMNMGLAKCYECDFTGAIDAYNQALKYKPNLSLAYQNKLLDVNYISHLIEDPMYIAKLHKNLNKIYPKVVTDYKTSCPGYTVNDIVLKSTSVQDLVKSGKRLVIGFVSGDYVCHPVSYFISGILKNLNYSAFEVHCYSVKLVQLENVYPNCKWHHVKDLSDTGLYDLIRSHKVDILFDLSAQTGDNRLNTFVLKPAPIQITYCGYPNSSGILSMDYRLTDKNCDGEESEKYYVEKLVYLKDVFLCYTSTSDVNNLPLTTPPCTKNNWITFGCFNRYNKINDMVVGVWEKLLKRIPNARFVIKTKEFGTKKVLDKFINCFKDKSVLERVQILDYADMYDEHLLDYNKMDIALDTFPYSGTTTSCEALLMGVPILTLYDNVRHYHSQNVTTSFMRNCGMEHFVAYSQEEYIEKAVEFSKNLNALSNIKQDVRHRFLTSPMSKHKEFAQNFEKTLLDIYKNHAW